MMVDERLESNMKTLEFLKMSLSEEDTTGKNQN